MRRSPMRVALVTPSFPPHRGGVEVHVRELASGLARLGCKVDVLTQAWVGDADPEVEETDQGVTVRRFMDRTRTKHFPVAPSLRRYLKRNCERFDIVHAHSFHAWPAMTAAKSAICPFVFTPHYHGRGHTPAARIVHAIYDPLAAAIFRKAVLVVCVSDVEAEAVARDYPHCRDRLVSIPNGIDLAAIRSARRMENTGPVVLTVGRLEHYKQVDLVVDAFSLLSSDAVLVIIGSGPAKDHIEQRIEQSGRRDRIRLLSDVSTPELRRWQRTAHVVVTMSRHEAFGLVLGEGIVAGSQVIASEIPAHLEIVRASGAQVNLLPPDTSAPGLAQALTRALAEAVPTNPDATFLSWSAIAERTLAEYESVLATE